MIPAIIVQKITCINFVIVILDDSDLLLESSHYTFLLQSW